MQVGCGTARSPSDDGSWTPTATGQHDSRSKDTGCSTSRRSLVGRPLASVHTASGERLSPVPSGKASWAPTRGTRANGCPSARWLSGWNLVPTAPARVPSTRPGHGHGQSKLNEHLDRPRPAAGLAAHWINRESSHNGPGGYPTLERRQPPGMQIRLWGDILHVGPIPWHAERRGLTKLQWFRLVRRG